MPRFEDMKLHDGKETNSYAISSLALHEVNGEFHTHLRKRTYCRLLTVSLSTMTTRTHDFQTLDYSNPSQNENSVMR
jgi:hypothetical protein